MCKKILCILMACMLVFGTNAFASESNMNAETVSKVQEFLNANGFDCGMVDGSFGPATQNAIRAFQEANGLAVDGTISEELLAWVNGEAPQDEGAASEEPASAEEPASIDTANAWNKLFLFITENGKDADGMTALTKLSGDYHTSIGILPEDSETIYFYTKGEYGEEGSSIDVDLRLALKKNDVNPEFSASSNTELSFQGMDAYTIENMYGHLNIAEVTARTKLGGEEYQKEVQDINGNVSSSTDLSESTMDGSNSRSLQHLLEDSAEILKSYGTGVSMQELGFFVNLPGTGLTLSPDEKLVNLAMDVYAVFPDGWKEEERNNVLNYYPPTNGDYVATSIVYNCTDLAYDPYVDNSYETLFDSFVSSFYNSDNYMVTDETKNITVAGFPARTVKCVLHGAEREFDVQYVVLSIGQFLVAIGMMQEQNVQIDYTETYQRILDTIFEDPDGTLSAQLTAQKAETMQEEPAQEEPAQEDAGQEDAGQETPAPALQEEEESSDILVDDEYVTITFQDTYEESNMLGFQVLVENKTDDKYLMINADHTSIDGLMTYLFVNDSQVSPGKKTKAKFVVYTSSDDHDIRSLDQFFNVEGSLSVWYNEDGGNSYSTLEQGIPFAVLQKKDGGGSDAAAEESSGENVLTDNEYVRITALETFEESNKVGMKLQIENKTEDKTIMVQADNTSVDGLMMYLYLENGTVSPGKRGIAELSVYTSNGDISSLEEFFNVEGTFSLWYNEDGSNSFSKLSDAGAFSLLEK